MFSDKVRKFFIKGEFQDFYQLLEADMDTTEEEIKKNYYRLCKIYHPDSLSGMADEDKISRLSEAYSILKDSMMRSIYNVYYVDFKMLHNHQMNEFTAMESDSTTSDQTSSMEENETPSFNQSSPMEGKVDTDFTQNQTDFSSTNTIQKDSDINLVKPKVHSTTKRGTNYHFKVSPNVIRNTLRRCNYSEEAIRDFLLWCQKHHIQIANGKELHSAFSKYLSFSEKSVKSMHQEPNHSVKEKTVNTERRKMNDNSTFNFLFYRELKACQTFVKEHYISSIRNLQIFDLDSFVTLIHTIQNVTIFFNENRNSDGRNVNVKTKSKKAS